jgi:hypothetical protein
LFLDSDDTIDRDKECSHRRTGATHSGICWVQMLERYLKMFFLTKLKMILSAYSCSLLTQTPIGPQNWLLVSTIITMMLFSSDWYPSPTPGYHLNATWWLMYSNTELTHMGLGIFSASHYSLYIALLDIIDFNF